MSLINKMLQDLDARGSQPGDTTMQPNIKSVTRAERRVSLPVLAGGAAIAVVLAAAGIFGWRYYQQLKVAPRPLPVAALAPAAAPAPAPVTTPAPPPPPAPESATVAAPVQRVRAAVPAAVAQARAPQAKPRVVETRPKRQAPAGAAKSEPRATQPAARVAAAAVPGAGREPAAQQRAESEYRRALASLQEGRVSDAVDGLERSIQIDPRHDAARQTLVGLLIENNRKEDAQRTLQAGLAVDPRQPAMAMLLARMQIEAGGSGVDTLMRTLPYAAGNSEYHAFLAGALQRAERHREAVEQYQAALRRAPDNGIWWMGLGISLQAEKRTAEAIDAYQRAKGSSALSPQLQAFVERKLQLLTR